jgi:hypothetical protein
VRSADAYRFSPEMLDFCWLVYNASPRAYEIARVILANGRMPDYGTLQYHFRDAKADMAARLGDLARIGATMARYRERLGVERETVIPGTVAYDATYCKMSGMIFEKQSKKISGAMAFMWEPFDHKYPKTLIFVFNTSNCRIDASCKKVEEAVVVAMEKSKFSVAFVATDGDKGKDSAHGKAYSYERYVAQVLAARPTFVFDQLADADIPNETAVQESLEDNEEWDFEAFLELKDVDFEVPGEDMDLGDVDPTDLRDVGDELIMPDGSGLRGSAG